MNTAFEGLKIISHYDSDFELSAGHEEIFVRFRNDVKMSEIDQEKMKNFGWSYNDEGYWRTFV